MMTYSRQNTENKEIEVKPTYDLIDEPQILANRMDRRSRPRMR